MQYICFIVLKVRCPNLKCQSITSEGVFSKLGKETECEI